jgi:hypothetical protein
MFPRGFILRVAIPLNLVKPGSLVLSVVVLLVQNVDRMGLVCQVWFQWDGIFNHTISRGLLTSFELGDMEHVVNSR